MWLLALRTPSRGPRTPSASGLPPARHCRPPVRLLALGAPPGRTLGDPASPSGLALGLRSRHPGCRPCAPLGFRGAPGGALPSAGRLVAGRAGGTSRAKPGGPRAPFGACSVCGGGAGPGAPPRTCACTDFRWGARVGAQVLRGHSRPVPSGRTPAAGDMVADVGWCIGLPPGARPLAHGPLWLAAWAGPCPGCWPVGRLRPVVAATTLLRWTAADLRGQVGSAPAGTVHPPGLPSGRTAHAQFRGGAPGRAPPPKPTEHRRGAGSPRLRPGGAPSANSHDGAAVGNAPEGAGTGPERGAGSPRLRPGGAPARQATAGRAAAAEGGAGEWRRVT
jgi:hypothetical protein